MTPRRESIESSGSSPSSSPFYQNDGLDLRTFSPQPKNQDGSSAKANSPSSFNAQRLGINESTLKSQSKAKMIQCKFCNHTATDKASLWDHIRVHMNPEQMLTCHLCNFVCVRRNHLKYHLKIHANEKPYKCHMCNYICITITMLKSHLKSHSDIRVYQCADCNFEAKHSRSLKLHLQKMNHGQKMVNQKKDETGVGKIKVEQETPQDLSCSSNNTTEEKIVPSDENKELQIDVAQGSDSKFDKWQFCPHCSMGFLNNMMYLIHMGLHGSKNPFQCTDCGESCSDSVSFALHLHRAKHNMGVDKILGNYFSN